MPQLWGPKRIVTAALRSGSLPDMRPPSVGTGTPRARRMSSATTPVQPVWWRGAEPRTVVAVEVLVEEHVVPPLRIGLEALDPAEAGPPPVVAADEERDQALAQVGGDLPERELVPGAVRVLDLELVAEEAGIAVERLDHDEVDRHPDRPAPVRVAAEHAGRRLGRLVVDRRAHPVDVERERMLGVPARDGPEPVGREELGLVEDPGEQPEDALDADDAEEHAALLGAASDRVRGRQQLACPLVHDLGPLDDVLVDRGHAEERQDARRSSARGAPRSGRRAA